MEYCIIFCVRPSVLDYTIGGVITILYVLILKYIHRNNKSDDYESYEKRELRIIFLSFCMIIIAFGLAVALHGIRTYLYNWE